MSVDQQFHAVAMKRKAESIESEQSSFDNVKPTKPTVSSVWDDPSFTDRVIARADRRQRILAQIRSKPKAYVSAKETVREMITQLMQTKGIDRKSAMSRIAKDRPDLIESMKLEANPQQQKRGWRQ